jgi:hypothetical protein
MQNACRCHGDLPPAVSTRPRWAAGLPATDCGGSQRVARMWHGCPAAFKVVSSLSPTCDCPAQLRSKVAMSDPYEPSTAACSGTDLARAASHLICRYLSGVQRYPDQFAGWHDRHPPVRIRSPAWEVVRADGSHVGSRRPRACCLGWRHRLMRFDQLPPEVRAAAAQRADALGQYRADLQHAAAGEWISCGGVDRS